LWTRGENKEGTDGNSMGYQALVEGPDGRKVELREENTDISKFIIEDKFKITGRGLVMAGVISEGRIYNKGNDHFLVYWIVG
jgi:hypothetical protein